MTSATKTELEQFAKHILKGFTDHMQTAPDTQKQLDNINDTLKTLGCVNNSKMLLRHERAIYGDSNDKTDKGMKFQLSELYNAFTGAKTGRKMILGIFIFISTIVAGFFAMIEFLKRLLVS